MAINTLYAVLLYPPVGSPRVMPIQMAATKKLMREAIGDKIQAFDTRDEAESALNKFLDENPEYRHWNNGSIVPPKKSPPATVKGLASLFKI